jgi:hypothetical protein
MMRISLFETKTDRKIRLVTEKIVGQEVLHDEIIFHHLKRRAAGISSLTPNLQLIDK